VVLGSPNEWFNPNAFILPAFGTYGNLGRGTLTGPGLATLDASMFKNVSISEKSHLTVPGGVLQPSQSGEFRATQCDAVHQRRQHGFHRSRHQPRSGIDYGNRNHFQADPVRAENGLLAVPIEPAKMLRGVRKLGSKSKSSSTLIVLVSAPPFAESPLSL
jgi:hypothetical protein